MSGVEVLSADDVRYYLGRQFDGAAQTMAEVIVKINRWLDRGDGVAVYVNLAFGHPDMGDIRFASFGSPAALIIADIPPQTLPDMSGVINWRYGLKGTYKGAAL